LFHVVTIVFLHSMQFKSVESMCLSLAHNLISFSVQIRHLSSTSSSSKNRSQMSSSIGFVGLGIMGEGSLTDQQKIAGSKRYRGSLDRTGARIAQRWSESFSKIVIRTLQRGCGACGVPPLPSACRLLGGCKIVFGGKRSLGGCVSAGESRLSTVQHWRNRICRQWR
jgi:hypothetical protein